MALSTTAGRCVYDQVVATAATLKTVKMSLHARATVELTLPFSGLA